MDPRYFAHTLTFYEAGLFLKGLERRKRSGWEAARYIAFQALRPYAKDGFSIEDMGKFYWEIPHKALADEEDEIRKLRERVRKEDEELLKKLNNGSGGH